MAEVIELRQVFQEGKEGWVEYPAVLLDGHRLVFARPGGWPDTWVVKRRDGFVYLQGEDAQCLIETQLEDRGLAPRYTQWSVGKFSAWLKSDEWPRLRKWKGD